MTASTVANRQIDVLEVWAQRASAFCRGVAVRLSSDLTLGPRRVILWLASPQSYLDRPHYLGVIAGRCSNHI